MPALLIRALAALVVIAAFVAGAPRGPQPAVASEPAAIDALDARVTGELATFTQWLAAGGAKGYIGEVGWPATADAAAWDVLARRWYAAAGEAGLHVDAWATGEWWGSSYPLSAYVASREYEGPLDVARSQAKVIEAQPGRRGIVLNGGEFGDVPQTQARSSFSNRTAGVYGHDWHYDGQASLDYLAARGITTVKIPFRWERLQPTLGAAFNAAELKRLKGAVERARKANLRVILDPHNYGGYYDFDGGHGVRKTIGSAALPDTVFNDLWRRLSNNFKANPTVEGYALMAEPAQMPSVDGLSPARVWERSSQRALTAIRRNGDAKLVYVPGYDWSGVAQWTKTHPRPWITDPTGNFRYEAHHYWDRDGSGSYASDYAAEVADAEARGWTAPATQPLTSSPAPPTTATATVTLSDDFASHVVGPWAEGSRQGDWTTRYTGYGDVSIVEEGGRSLRLAPRAASHPDVTHAALVTSVQQFGDLSLRASMRTVKQLRTTSAPNTWETAWLLWNFTDDTHFYYFVLKANGWELGKGDPAYAGAQRFLATGDRPTVTLGAWQRVEVRQRGAVIEISVDGAPVVTFADEERPYLRGSVALYTEDADVRFDDVNVETVQ